MRTGKAKRSKTRRLSLTRHDKGLKACDRANYRANRSGKPGLKKLAARDRDAWEADQPTG